MKPTAQLQVALNETRSVPLVILAVFDASSAQLAGKAGCKACTLGSATCSNAYLGLPDAVTSIFRRGRRRRGFSNRRAVRR